MISRLYNMNTDKILFLSELKNFVLTDLMLDTIYLQIHAEEYSEDIS